MAFRSMMGEPEKMLIPAPSHAPLFRIVLLTILGDPLLRTLPSNELAMKIPTPLLFATIQRMIVGDEPIT